MVKNVIVTNYLGKSVKYSFEGPTIEDESGLFITEISGLGPVKAGINMTKLATADGQIFNSSRLDGRNIVIKARFTYAKTVEEARLLSYKFFPIGKPVTFHIETDNRIAETSGYVESNTPNPFSSKSDVQISIICESSFFNGVGLDNNKSTIFSNVIDEFEFPGTYSQSTGKWNGTLEFTDDSIEFSKLINKKENTVYYDGDSETGCIIKIHMIGKAKGIKIVNVKTGKTMLIETDKLGSVLATHVASVPKALVKEASQGGDFDNLDSEAINFMNKWGNDQVFYISDSYINADSPSSVEQFFKGYIVKLEGPTKIDNGETTGPYGYKFAWKRVDINYFIAGDSVTINTIKGHKSITLLRDGRTINILNTLGKNVDWFQITRGDNIFAYTAQYGEANIQFTIDTQTIYEGV